MSDVKLGEWVLYQPFPKEWPMAPTLQAPACVCDYDEESKAASLVILHPGAGYIGQVRNPVFYGDADGQFMKVGEESKTAKAAKKAKEDAKKAAEEVAKKDEEKAKKMIEEAKEKTTFPTTQQQLDRDQARQIAQYKYPQPPAD
jgi:hypothetical protein